MDLSGILTAKDLRLKGTLKKLSLKGALDGTGAALNLWPDSAQSCRNSIRRYSRRPIRKRFASLGPNESETEYMELTGNGEVNLGDVPVLNLSLASNRFSLDGWEKIIPLLNDYQLSGNLEVQKTNVQGKLGKGAMPQIQGSLTLSGVSAKPPQFPKPIKDLDTRIDFTGQRATLKRYDTQLGKLAHPFSGGDRPLFSSLTLTYRLSTPEIWPADFQASLPEDRKTDVIKNLSSEGTLSAQDGALRFRGKLASTQGTLYKIDYKDLGTNLTLENKIASIQNLRLNALNGSLQAEAQYAFNSATPRFSLVSKAQGLDLRELYRSVDSKSTRDIQGRLNADMKISGKRQRVERNQANLRGQGQAEVFARGAVRFQHRG